MTSNKELETGLKAIMEDFHLPGAGRKKLSRLVADHLWWFDAAEQRGMGWRDMIRALTAAGLTSKSGKPLTVSTLSSTVWRERAKVRGKKTNRPSDKAQLDPPSSTRPHRKPRKEAKRLATEQPRRKKYSSSMQIDTYAATTRPVSNPSKRPTGGPRGQANKDVLAFMDRARAMRRQPEEK